MGTNSSDAAANRAKGEDANRNLTSISPFFIVKDLQVSISYYIERLGFQLDFQGPDDDPYYAGVSGMSLPSFASAATRGPCGTSQGNIHMEPTRASS